MAETRIEAEMIVFETNRALDSFFQIREALIASAMLQLLHLAKFAITDMVSNGRT